RVRVEQGGGVRAFGSPAALGGVLALVGLLMVLHLLGWADLGTAVGIAGASGLVLLLLTVLYFGALLADRSRPPAERRRIGAILVLFCFSTVFWAGFEQGGSSLNLFARDLTDRRVLGWEIPAGFLQSVNSLFIITLAPLFGWVWIRLAARNREPSSPAKFAFGLVALGAGFVVMAAASARAIAGGPVSPGWLVLTYLLHSIGELALSPVGLSTVTKLAPQAMAGQMMGVWFLSLSLGSLLAGQVAGLYESLALPALFGAVAAS